MDWRDLTRNQAGAIARRQLTQCGISAAAIDGMVARRELMPLLAGVYSPRPVPTSMAQSEWAAVLWSGGVLSHRSAAGRWGIAAPSPGSVHVTVGDLRFRRTAPRVRVHRVRIEASEWTCVHGLAITLRDRTAIDLMRTERYGAARDIRDRALQLGWLTPADVVRSVTKQLGRTGNAQLRRLIAELDVGAQAESERLLHAILRRGGLAGWRAQYRVRLAGRVAYLDVAFPDSMLAIEVDGRRYHGDESSRFEDDRSRQNALVAAGWRVLRVTWSMLVDQPDQVLTQIAQLLAA